MTLATFVFAFYILIYAASWYLDYLGSTHAAARQWGESSPLMRDSSGRLVVWKMHVVKSAMLIAMTAVTALTAKYDVNAALLIGGLFTGVSFLATLFAVLRFL